MHRFIFPMLLIVLFGTVEGISQTDWSSAFPAVKGCERSIQPLERSEYDISQRAVYRRQVGVCGTITIRVMPGIRKSLETWSTSPFVRRVKVRGLSARLVPSRCSTPPGGGMSVYVSFAENAEFAVHVYEIDSDLMSTPYKVDYAMMARLIPGIASNKW